MLCLWKRVGSVFAWYNVRVLHLSGLCEPEVIVNSKLKILDFFVPPSKSARTSCYTGATAVAKVKQTCSSSIICVIGRFEVLRNHVGVNPVQKVKRKYKLV